jgi:Tfp pilus assembly PilM family ATPase
MGARSNNISGLDFQKDYISIAQFIPDEQSVTLVAIQPIENGADGELWDKVARELKGLKGKFKFTSPDVVCSLPSEYAIVKRMAIDSDEQEPSDVIEWELSQQIIGSMDDYIFDFQEAGQSKEDGLVEYLVVAYRNQVVQKITSIARNCKLNPLVVDLDICALINVFEANYRERLSAPAIIVHAENGLSKLILAQNSNLLDFATFAYDAALIEGDLYADRLQGEIGRFLSVNGTFVSGDPIGVYLSGSFFSQSAFLETVVNTVPNSELLYPFRKLDCRIGVDEEQLKKYAAQLSVAVGLALRGND